MRLRTLLAVLPEAHLEEPDDPQSGIGYDPLISGIECDSRRLGPGGLFVAIRGGEEKDRHQFVADAVARGAAAVVVEEQVEAGPAAQVRVPSCRRALAVLAAHYYGNPGEQLRLVGITGTKGKTTTAFLVRQILEAAGWPCGYLGTLGCLVHDQVENSVNTTPEAADLHRLLRAMAEAGKRAAALEVTSHALALERVAGLRFDAGIFTNLSRDHLDFHQTWGKYLEAKASLFAQLKEGGVAVVNLDDPVAPQVLARIPGPAWTFGRAPQSRVALRRVEPSERGMRLELDTPLGVLMVDTPLTGDFNCHNVMAAVACGLALELAPEAVAQGVAALGSVPGRFERVVGGQSFEVIVDYAHSPASLEAVLHTARGLTRQRLICVFGCGGDRDRGKRPQMGRIAGELADLVYVTSDNPRTESPEAIIAQIAAGVEQPGKLQVRPDRRQAIGEALGAAGDGDVVVIAGKGHEPVQILADRTVPFDDRQVARQVLQELAPRVGDRREPCTTSP